MKNNIKSILIATFAITCILFTLGIFIIGMLDALFGIDLWVYPDQILMYAPVLVVIGAITVIGSSDEKI